MNPDADRVRRHTAASVLRCIDDETAARLTRYAQAPPAAIAGRLKELDREWDTDRAIETEASLMGLVGLGAGLLLHPRAFALSGFVAAGVLVHALTGWYPLLPLFRRAGVRSAREIARERYALKALRGDFSSLAASARHEGAEAARGAAEPAHGADADADADERAPGPGIH